MLELQFKWLLVLLVNFLVLIYVLNILLFKPLLGLFKKREDNVNGALGAAKDMNQKKEETIAKLSRELTGARNKAKETFEALRGEGANTQREVFSKAEAEATDILQKARQELKAEAEKARQALKSDVDKFSDEIVRKLVKA